MSRSFAARIAETLRRTEFVDRHYQAMLFKKDKRAATVDRMPDWEDRRVRAQDLKAEVRSRLDGFVETFSERARGRGVHVHHAATALDANETVLRIAREHGATRLVKSKSMTTEECGLNPYLEQRGIEIVDTDLGERIVQLFGEPPSHIVTPAVHRSRKEIGALFAEHGLCEAGEEDPTRLTIAARHSLRELFLGAELGITGANFLIAETGTVVVVENEANSLLGTSLPRVHVVVAGIEKLVAQVDDLATLLTVLAPSSTGQRLTTYTTHYTGPQPASPAERERGLADHQLHVILLDNGRSDLVGTPAEEGLACIRCGACLNICPVFRRVGGHSYGFVYPGPIGKVLAPGFDRDRCAELPKASSLCGACTDVCATRIDLKKHIYEWRGELRQQGQLRAALPPGLGLLLRRPGWWRLAMGTLRRLGPIGGWALRQTPWVRAYQAGGARRLPAIPDQTFRQWWRTRQGPQPSSVPPEAEQGREETPATVPVDVDLEAQFDEALREAGGEAITLDELPSGVVATAAARATLADRGHVVPAAPIGKDELNGVEWLVATARRRLAWSGTLWVDFDELESRAQLLLSEGLILLVPAAELVPGLDQHYQRIRREGLPVCGTLVTGPSKTADIEQTLVFGAHGPRRLLVLALEDPPA